jgi:hypothetical protein
MSAKLAPARKADPKSGAGSSGLEASSLIFSGDIGTYYPNTLHKEAAASMAFCFTSDKKNAS